MSNDHACVMCGGSLRHHRRDAVCCGGSCRADLSRLKHASPVVSRLSGLLDEMRGRVHDAPPEPAQAHQTPPETMQMTLWSE